MKLTLSLESDEVIDVPDEAVIEEIDPGKEIVEGFKKLDSFFEIIANLKHVQDNIKRFGVTKELVHLINKDRNFSDSTNITLPYYESDEEEINEEELPDGEELIAATEGVIGKAKDGIVAAFKWLKEKIVTFFKWLWDLITFKKKKVEAVNEDLKEENIVKEAKEKAATEGNENINTDFSEAAKDATNKVEVKFFNKKLAFDLLKAFEFGFNTIAKIKIDDSDGFKIKCDCPDFTTWQKALGMKGYFELSEDKKYFIWNRDEKYTIENEGGIVKDTLRNLGYDNVNDFSSIGEHIHKVSDIFKKLLSLKKDMEDRLNRIIKRISSDSIDFEHAETDEDRKLIKADIDEGHEIKDLIVSIQHLLNVITRMFDKFTTAYIDAATTVHRNVLDFYSAAIKH